MSRFNHDMLCEDCIDKERAHPDYPRARDVEMQAVLNGDYNFAGIGLPIDLRRRNSPV